MDTTWLFCKPTLGWRFGVGRRQKFGRLIPTEEKKLRSQTCSTIDSFDGDADEDPKSPTSSVSTASLFSEASSDSLERHVECFGDEPNLVEVLETLHVFPLLNFLPPSACARLSQCSKAFGCRKEGQEGFVSRASMNDAIDHYLWHTNSTGQRRTTKATMHDGAEEGDAEIIWSWLYLGSSPNEYDLHGCVPLHYAASMNKGQETSLLIKAGADLQSTHHGRNVRAGWTPLHFAAYAGARDVLALLLFKGAAVNEMDVCRRTPLFYAEDKNREACSRILKKFGGVADLHLLEEKHLSDVNNYDSGTPKSVPDGSIQRLERLEFFFDLAPPEDQQVMPEGTHSS